MELNTAIWGDNTEWQEDTIISYNDENAPKAYHGKYLNLGDYRNNGLVEFNTPIDNSIAYCGHAPNVSPYGDRAVYFWEAGDTPTITPRWRCQDKCDIALFDVPNGTANYNLDLLYGVRGFVEQNGEWLTETGFTRWLDYGNINLRYPDDYKQENLLVQPVVEFDPRVMFGVIMVTYYDENNNLQTTTLHELESNPNHNNCQIINAELSPAIVKEWYNNDNFGRYGTIIYDENKTFNMLSLKPINIDNGKILTYNTRMYRNAKFPLVGCESIIGVYSQIQIEHATGDYPIKISWNNYHYNNSDKEWGDEMSAGLILYGNSLLNVGNATAEHRTDYDINSIYYSCPATTETCEKIRRLAACYGLFFTDNPTNLYNNPDRWTNSDMMLGLLVDGVGYGDYTRGADNIDNPAYNWTSSHESGYDPAKNIDPNTYSTQTNFNTVGNVAATTKQYVLNGVGVSALTSELWSCIASLILDPSDLPNLNNMIYDEFLTNNPIDCLISLKKFPVMSVPHGSTLENLKLGKYTASTAGYTLSGTQFEYLFEPIDIYARLGGSFLDYAPYTEMQLYVPFCGTTDIDPADFMGHKLTVRMVIDYITGACTAYIQADGLVVKTLQGTCAIDIPITGTEQATISDTLQRNIGAWSSATKDTTMSVVPQMKMLTNPTKWAEQRFNAYRNAIDKTYELTHTQIPLRTIGAASPLNSWALEFAIRLIIYYPDGDIITFTANNTPTLNSDKLHNFGEVNGFATVETDTLNNYTGYTECANANLDGIAATDTEKEMIMDLLKTGIYL